MEESDLVFIFIKEEHKVLTSRRVFILETALDQIQMEGRSPHDDESPMDFIKSNQYKPKYLIINIEHPEFDEIINIYKETFPISPIIAVYNPDNIEKLAAIEEKYQIKYTLNKTSVNTFALTNLFCKIKSDQVFLQKNENQNQRYAFIQSLGKGTTSSVDLYYDKVKERKVAIKKMRAEGMKSEMKDQIMKEVNNMKSIKIPTSVEFYDFEIENDNRFIYMEYATKGTLESQIYENKKSGQQFEIDQIFDYLVEIMLALYALNQKGMMHRDIKSENILLTSITAKEKEYTIAKLSDLGLSRKIDGVIGSLTSCGTPYYVSPEIASGDKRYTYNADIWSLGVVLYELITLNKPWYDPNLFTHELYNLIFKTKYPPLPEETDGRLKFLVRIMLIKEPKVRATLDEILHLDFMYEKTMEVITKFGWEDVDEFKGIKDFKDNLKPCYLFMKVLEDEDFNNLMDSGFLYCYSIPYKYKPSYFGNPIKEGRKGDELVKTFGDINEWENDSSPLKGKNLDELLKTMLDKKILIPLTHTLSDTDKFVEDFLANPSSYVFKFSIDDFDPSTTAFDNKYLCVSKPVPENYSFLGLSQFVLKQGKKLYKDVIANNTEPIEIPLEPRFVLFYAGIALFQECDLFALPYTEDDKTRLAFLLNVYQIMILHSCFNKLLQHEKIKSGLLGYFQYDININYKFKNFTLNNVEMVNIVFRNNKPAPGSYMRMVYASDPKCQLLPNYDNLHVLFLLLYDPSVYTNSVDPEYFFTIFNERNVDELLLNITIRLIPYTLRVSPKELDVAAPFEHYIVDFKDIVSFLRFIIKIVNNQKEYQQKKPYKVLLCEDEIKSLETLNEKYLDDIEKKKIHISYYSPIFPLYSNKTKDNYKKYMKSEYRMFI